MIIPRISIRFDVFFLLIDVRERGGNADFQHLSITLFSLFLLLDRVSAV